MSMFRFVTLFVAVSLLPACARYQSEELPASMAAGETYYSQFSLQYEKGRYRTTNYRRGTLLPVNSPVQLLGMNRKSVTVRLLPSGEELIIENVHKFTRDDTLGAFNKIFARQPRDLGRFNAMERRNIEAGRVEPGMRKEAVLAAIGYPPAHETPNLELDQWRYWANRFNTFVVHFDNGRVVRIQN